MRNVHTGCDLLRSLCCDTVDEHVHIQQEELRHEDAKKWEIDMIVKKRWNATYRMYESSLMSNVTSSKRTDGAEMRKVLWSWNEKLDN
jgi:hypothetical protein